MTSHPSAAERLKELEKASQEAPKESELAITLAEAYLREGRVEEAAAQYARSAELDPRAELKSLYWEWLGLVQESRGELEAALDAYFQWLDSDPSTVEPLDRLGTLLVTLQRWTDIVLLRPHYLSRAESLGPQGKESLALYSFVLDQLGTPEEVAPLDRAYAALEADSDALAMRYLLGVLFFRTGHLEAARGEFERVLSLDPHGMWLERRFSLLWDTATARIMLARIARMQGNPQEALERLSESFSLKDDNPEGLTEVASVLLDNERYEELLELLPTDEDMPAWMDRYRAESYLGLGRVEQAEQRYVAELEPEPAAGEAELAAMPARRRRSLEAAEEALGEGDLQGALRKFDKLCAQEEPTWQAHWGRARCLAELSEFEPAAAELEKVVALQPGLEAVWQLLSHVYDRLGSKRRSRLAAIQREKLLAPEPVRGLIWPAPEGSSAAGLLIQARALPGKGNLIVTGEGGERARELARVALTVLQGSVDGLSLEDPAYRDLHLHLRAVGTGSVAEGPVPTVSAGPQEPEPLLNDEAGAAIVASLALSLLGRLPEGVVVSGRLDLDGQVRGPVDIGEGLGALLVSGVRWGRLVIPRNSAPELLRLPADLWLDCELRLCDSVASLVRAVGGPSS